MKASMADDPIPGALLPPLARPLQRMRALFLRALQLPSSHVRGLAFWRERVLEGILLLTAVLGIAVYLPSVVLCARLHLWSVVVVDTAAFGWVVAAAFSSRGSYATRAWGLMATFYALALVLLVRTGLVGAAMLWVCVLPTMAAVLIGLEAAVTFWLLSALTLGACVLGIPDGFMKGLVPVLGDINQLTAWLAVSANALFLSAATALPIALLLRGLEHRDQALALEEERFNTVSQRLQVATGSAGIGIWEWDIGRDVHLWDERMVGIHGVPAGTSPAPGGAWLDLVHPEDRAVVAQRNLDAVEGDGNLDLTYRILRPDGAVRHLKVDALVVRDAQGRAQRLVGMARDVTAQAEAESERQRLETELQHAQKLESLGSLAGGVAHDMNNILTAILGLGSTLQHQYGADPALARGLGTIVQAGERGTKLVRHLTEFARKGLDEARPVDLNELVRREADLLGSTTLRKVTLECRLEEGLPLILGEPAALSNALMNLCVNALDAMPEGGVLGLATRALAGQVELTVADTGQGMTPAVQARAMEPFFTTKPLGKGTGLGLAGVYGTMKAHGGTVELQSQVGEGTRVTLSFPAALTSGRAPGTRAEAGAAAAAPPLRILLVDDDPIIRKTLPDMLTFLGHTVTTAALGQEALDLLGGGLAVDLVVLDHNMPGLTGAETLVRIKAAESRQAVLLSTGFLEPQVEALAATLPRVWLLIKPYSLQGIRKKLEEIQKDWDRC